MSSFSVRPMAVGAEIIGLAADDPLDGDSAAGLYKAWLDHGILLFRGVSTVEQHLAITRCFGELEIHPVPEVRSATNPFLIELGAPFDGGGSRVPTVFVFDDDDMRINRIAWHRDTAYAPDICKGAMLRMLEVPEHEGETMVADTAKAWDDLPAEVQQRLETLEFKATLRTAHLNLTGRAGVFWDSVRLASDEEFPGNEERSQRDGALDGRYPSVIHPAVMTYPNRAASASSSARPMSITSSTWSATKAMHC